MSEQTSSAGEGEDRNAAWKSVATGLAGAAALTLSHEVLRQLVPSAPRMDRLGMAAISRGLSALGISAPRGQRLRGFSLAGDIVSNALFYALVRGGRRRSSWLRGGALGLAAGLGALVLPGVLGLPRRHSSRTRETQAMTVALLHGSRVRLGRDGLLAGCRRALRQGSASACGRMTAVAGFVMRFRTVSSDNNGRWSEKSRWCPRSGYEKSKADLAICGSWAQAELPATCGT